MQPEVKVWTRRQFEASGERYQVLADHGAATLFPRPEVGSYCLELRRKDLPELQAMLRELEKFWTDEEAK